MADLQNYSVTAGNAVQVTTLDWVITATVQEGNDVLADFTGANALHYPAVLATLTLEQQNDLISQIAQQIVLVKAGL